jgi:rhodanese-related sulfurtransferase
MDITVQELREKLAAGEKFIFIDVREPWEYEEFNLGATLSATS